MLHDGQVMRPLDADDVLALACSREGSCCFGALVPLTPWELAVLAHGASLSLREFRARHTRAGGTILCFTNQAAGLPGKPACNLYAAGQGCSVHASRPLACRLFPLSSARVDGRRTYQRPGRCAELCPKSVELPRVRLGDYLAEQQVAAGEQAHDAYAGMLAALAATAAEIATRLGAQHDHQRTHEHLHRLAEADPQAKADLLPAAALDLLTIPPCTTPLGQPDAFVTEHRQLIASAIGDGFGLPGPQEVVHALLGMAFLLAAALGTDPGLVAEAYGSRLA